MLPRGGQDGARLGAPGGWAYCPPTRLTHREEQRAVQLATGGVRGAWESDT